MLWLLSVGVPILPINTQCSLPLREYGVLLRAFRPPLGVRDGREVGHHILCLVLELHVQFAHVQLLVLQTCRLEEGGGREIM